MSIPKKHHYVPQCYLKEYGEMKQLICLDISLVLKGIKAKPSFKEPAQICYTFNYYKITNGNLFNLKEYNENFIELSAFSTLENSYREVVKRILEKGELNRYEAKIFSDFILHLKIRNPSFNKFIDHHKERNTEIAKKQLIEKLMMKNEFGNYPYSLLKMQVDSFGEKILKSPNFNKSLQLKQLIDKTSDKSSSVEKFRKEILDCKWFILDSQKCDLSFITSDNPGISITNDGVLENMKFKGGFKYYFPINARYCLYFSDHEKDGFYTSMINDSKKLHINNIINEELNLLNIQQICYYNKYAISTDENNLLYIREELMKE